MREFRFRTSFGYVSASFKLNVSPHWEARGNLDHHLLAFLNRPGEAKLSLYCGNSVATT